MRRRARKRIARSRDRSRSVRSRVLTGAVMAAVVIAIGFMVVVVAGRRSAESPVPEALDARRRVPAGTRNRVEVLNASEVSGLARDATEVLRDAGFDVVTFGNARVSDADTSVVFDRVSRPEIARAVADVLGIHNVRSEPDSNLYVDVSVLLGSEWRRPDASAVAEGGR
jgi:hypothetical protein